MTADARTRVPPAARRPRRRWRRLRLVGYLLPVLIVLAGLPLYVFPGMDDPHHVDVAYVLGSPDVWRVRLAQRLLTEGRTEAILISVPRAKQAPSVCDSAERHDVVCRAPDVSTTEGESRLLRSEMRAHGWRTALAITSTPHVTRARLILHQCVPDGVGVTGRSDGIDLGEWIRQYLYQTAALVKAVAVPAC